MPYLLGDLPGGEVDIRHHRMDDADVGEAAVVDTFATYHPAKVFLGKAHPDPVVETSALAVSQLCVCQLLLCS